MRKILLYIIAFVGVVAYAKSPVAVYDNGSYISSIYNMDESGYHSIDSVALPQGYRILFDAYHLFWQSIGEEDENKMKVAEQVINVLELKDVQDPLLKVSVALLKMRIALINKSYLEALQSQMIIKHYFATAEQKKEPYDKFLRGMYHYFVSYGRSKNLFYRTCLAGWAQADAECGIQYLEEVADYNSVLISTEAHYFLGRIYLEYEGAPQKALLHFKILTQRYPDNRVYADFLSQCI